MMKTRADLVAKLEHDVIHNRANILTILDRHPAPEELWWKQRWIKRLHQEISETQNRLASLREKDKRQHNK